MRQGCVGDSDASLEAQSLNLTNSRDLATIFNTQQLGGGWELEWMWRYGLVDAKVGC